MHDSAPLHPQRYEILHALGEGGMGLVYAARDRDSGETVALKTLREQAPDDLLRFKQEFRVLADVAHPNLVELGELVEESGRWYFTMELVDGVDFIEYVTGAPSRTAIDAPRPSDPPEPDPDDDAKATIALPRARISNVDDGSTPSSRGLADATVTTGSDSWGTTPSGLDRTPSAPGAEATNESAPRPRRRRGRLDEARLRIALPQLVDALAALHRAGLVHRDVKPSNVLVEGDGRVVLLDLGIATHADPIEAYDRETDVIVGTASFMAPEQAKGVAPAPAADLYALGVMLFESLTGKLPFRGSAAQVIRAKQTAMPPRPSDVDENVPSDLDELCARLLDPDPDRRPDSDAILQALAVAPSSSASAPNRRIFVGREREMDLLGSAFELATSRSVPATQLVVGVPGVGKSELVRSFLRQALRAKPDALVLRGRCRQQESVPYKAFDGIVDALARELATWDEAAIDAVVPPGIEDLVALFPALGRVERFRTSARDGGVELARPGARSRAFEAMRALLDRIASERATILVVDDAQWADVQSHALLRAVLAPPGPPPLFVVATARPELVERIDAEPDGSLARSFGSFTRITLRGLDEGDARALVASLGGALEPDIAARLERHVASAAGHPMLLRELMLAATEGRTFDDGDAASSLERILWSRVAGRSESERAVLSVLALSGSRLEREVLADATSMRKRDCARALRSLRAAQLVRLESQGARVFVELHHDRIRDAVLAHLAAGERVAIHSAIAASFRTHGVGEIDPLAYVGHLEASGAADAAGAEALEAASRLASGLAFETYAALLAEAVRLGAVPAEARATTSRAIADAYRAAGRARDAGKHYLEACESSDPALKRSSRRLAAEQMILSGDIARGTQMLELALAEAGVVRPPRFLMMLAIPIRERRLLFGSDPKTPLGREATQEERDGLEVRAAVFRSMNLVDPVTTAYHLYGHGLAAREMRDPERFAESFVMAVMAYATMHGTSKSDVIATLKKRLQVATAEMSPSVRSWVEACEATIDGVTIGVDAMIDRLLRIEHQWLREPERDAMRLVFIRMALLESLRTAGRLAEGCEYAARMQREADRTSDLLLETFVVKVQNIAYLVRDEPAAALAALDRPLWTSAESGFHIHHLYELRARVEIDLYRGETKGLAEKHRKRLRQARFSMMSLLRAFKLEFGFVEGRILLVDETASPARRASKVRAIAERMVDPGNPDHAPRALLLRAGASALVGDRARTRDELREAIAAAESRSLALESCIGWMRLGAIDGTPDFVDRAERARAKLTSEGVKDVDRFAGVFSPAVGIFAKR